uniref:Cyclase associated actin cytoskeleton regulatory protein 2 n=1 Tax=Naja naja TaxID=35670 RepID=A0A8C6XSK7_NAJNA
MYRRLMVELELLVSHSKERRTSRTIYLDSISRHELAPYVEAFDRLMNESVAEFIKNSKILDGDIKTHAEMVHAAFQAQRAFLWLTSHYQEPQENEVAILLKPISEKIQEIQTFRERNRGSNMFNHLSAVSESIPALGWITIGPVASAASSFPAVVNKQGLPPPPPPPPPPPGPPPAIGIENAKDDATASRSALFEQLNQGETITKGLRHVSDDQKTHKNPSLRAQGVPMQSPIKTYTSESPKIPPQKSYSPVLELEGKKWRVEYQEDKNDLLISDTELKQVAYIFKCNKSTLQIKGKVNSIIVDNCKKFGLVFHNVVGIVEVINSKDIQIQVLGKVPTISVNKTEGCHIYLSEESLDCEIVSAKSSEMNILIPVNGDYKEFPVPEQFKTSWDGSKLVTDPTEIMG